MLTGVLFPIAALLRWVSRILCLIVIASFVLFAVNQTGTASTHQQQAVLTGSESTTTSAAHESSGRKTIEEVADKLTSPFSGVTAGSTSQWAVRGVGTVLALLVYGIGLGYLARVLRLRF
jgi:hypothetical protein